MSKLLTLLFLGCFCSLAVAWKDPNDNCVFSIPSTEDQGNCVNYDLSKLAGMGPKSFVANGYNYLLGLCGNIPDSMIPKQCMQVNSTFGPAVAYQFTADSCYAMGKLDASFMFPVDASNSSAGLRIVYGKGETSASESDPWPRAVIYDFECNTEALVDSNPLTLVEFPGYTYTVHWGMYSVPAFKNEWYWKRLMSGEAEYVEFHNKNYGCSGVMPEKFPCTGPKFPDFAPMFKAELFQPDEWADLFKMAGAKYVVLTSKHHEGWCNFPNSYHWNWNSVDVGPNRDLVGDLTNSVRTAGLHMGLYHSLREWYHPLYEMDNKDNCSGTLFPDQVLLPTLKEMVEQYKPEVIWADGAGDAPCTHDSIKYWKSPQFLSWLYNESPVKDSVLVNSRWGRPAIGDYQTGGDRYTPGKLVPYKWESCYTIQMSSWGYDRTEGITRFWNTTRLLWQLASSVSCNGNLLLNVGPTADGRIVPAFEERLLDMGTWLKLNGEAIYETVPWKFQNDTAAQDIWYTATKEIVDPIVYAICFRPPTPGGTIVLKQIQKAQETYLLGYGDNALSAMSGPNGLSITFPEDVPLGSLQHAWVFKLLHVQ
ncbi:plasma alpha-L-fucosidase-like [Halichondria panicea]|uniref:plasma alpha-L-fucosidase-like n=1 Tax=Halichondria panicea TaxID=6063 RepID=UPI00312B559B